MQQKPIPNADRTRTTRAALIAAARRLFIEQGYADTGTPQIVKEAGVTRGALYHHFEDKAALFEAVLDAEAEAIATVIEARTNTDMAALDALTIGGEAYLDAMMEPGRAHLLLVEGPAALGPERLASIHARHGERTLADGLHHAQKLGHLSGVPAEALATLLSAMFDSAAVEVAGGASMKEHKDALRYVLGKVLSTG
ncbi:MAG: TetR/AcrR family transcriptional regulator [Pseudomonadota bacterium]